MARGRRGLRARRHKLKQVNGMSRDHTDELQNQQTRDEAEIGRYARGQRITGQDGHKSGQEIARDIVMHAGQQHDMTPQGVVHYLEHIMASMAEENEWVRRRLEIQLENARKVS